MKLQFGAVVVAAALHSAIGSQHSASHVTDCRMPTAECFSDHRLLTVECSQSRTIWDGVYTAEQAKRGEAAYSAQCSACHGAMLDGVDAAPALMGGGFMARWDGVNLGDMVERIRVSMPLSDPGSLSRQQIVDLLSYILSVNGVPPGEVELTAEPARLSQVLFKAGKPGSH